jgi:ATP-dependent helicase/nuclease subunit B
VTGFEYWKLGKDGTTGRFGSRRPLTDPAGAKQRIPTGRFLPMVEGFFDEAAARWLTGEDAFEARPHSDAPVFTDYDQLMRLDEWFGRARGPGGVDG